MTTKLKLHVLPEPPEFTSYDHGETFKPTEVKIGAIYVCVWTNWPTRPVSRHGSGFACEEWTPSQGWTKLQRMLGVRDLRFYTADDYKSLQDHVVRRLAQDERDRQAARQRAAGLRRRESMARKTAEVLGVEVGSVFQGDDYFVEGNKRRKGMVSITLSDAAFKKLLKGAKS
jgi:hypothetical protein